ncbi:MAG: glycosyltransferase [Acidimicrobiales bacterium]|nr:glycosyltransferase [Acidimicrobiales bacterium]
MSPRVTVVMLCYNKSELSLRCLTSLEVCQQGDEPFDLIVVDNGSSDDTPHLLSRLEGAHTIRIDDNIGFGPANNVGAAEAETEYILFLSNDVVLLPGWLEPLVRAMDEDPTIGAVQPMFLYPDGRVNDAGGLTFADGECWNYGKGNPFPDTPALNTRRAPDYCTGACLLVRREAFEQVGGFDPRFAPVYYEDVDLSFAMREAGWKVMYEPTSKVVHDEGGTNGTDVSEGEKRYQVVNRPKFVEKWGHRLRQRPRLNPGLIEYWAHRGQGGYGPGEAGELNPDAAQAKERRGLHILISDTLVPMPDRNGMHPRSIAMIEELRAQGHSVVLFSVNSLWHERYAPPLQRLGVIVFAGRPDLQVADPTTNEIYGQLHRPRLPWILNNYAFDTAILTVWENAEMFSDVVRKASPQTTVVVDTIDVHWLRIEREATLKGDAEAKLHALELKRREKEQYRLADRVVAINEQDRKVIHAELPEVRQVVLPTVHEPVDRGPAYDDRDTIVFVGNFLHPPNVDAIRWWIDEVGDELAQVLPGVRLRVIGDALDKQISSIPESLLDVAGWVPDLKSELHRARLSVAPLRFGAGLKTKVLESLGAGLPVVTTSIGAEGIDLDPSLLPIADDARAFAAEVASLYNDRDRWQRISTEGREEVGRVYGIEAFRAALPAVVAPVRERSSRLMKVMGPAASNVVDLRQTEPNGELIGAIRRL